MSSMIPPSHGPEPHPVIQLPAGPVSLREKFKDGFHINHAQRNPALDSVRGLLAMMICIAHMSGSGFNFLPLSWAYAGGLRINIFGRATH